MSNKSIAPRLDFLSPVSTVPGIGPQRAEALRLSGIETIGDLLHYFPRRHVDRSTIMPIAELSSHINETCTVIGDIAETRVEKGKTPRLRIRVVDNGASLEALWFNGIPFLRAALRTGMRVLMTGKVAVFKNLQMTHPQIEHLRDGAGRPDILYMPQYRITGAMKEAGIAQKTVIKSIQWLLKNITHYPQILPASIEDKKKFPPLDECLRQMHFPDDPLDSEPFRRRLCYEELYTIALTLRLNRRGFSRPGRRLDAGELARRFERTLPFTLTAQQRRAVTVLRDDSASPRRMHRLLQGDVGSGKTVVAFLACLPALDSGFQVAWLAPTEVLAYQSFMQIKQWLDILDVKVELLKGGLAPRARQEILRKLAAGDLRFIVGTHALLQHAVTFARLGMVVIDEQHRFGVAQRQVLQEKDPASDFLLMSATPIPQTLGRTLYGDLDIVTIEGLPPGRRPVRTHVVPPARRSDMEQFIHKEITASANRVFYVVPRVDQDDDEDEESDLKDAQTTYARLVRGIFHDVPAAFIHGRMPSDEKERIVREFSGGAIRLLVATTVIEVGIDTPDATIMVIENPERFGLAQLHQLRGRVGRGVKESYCFLPVTTTLEDAARQRLEAFCGNHDGFEIAELDLRLRGPGNMIGLRQSGWDDLRMSAILDNMEMFREIQEELDLRLK